MLPGGYARATNLLNGLKNSVLKRGFAAPSEGGLQTRSVQEVATRVACTQLFLSRWGVESAYADNASDERHKTAFEAITRATEETGVYVDFTEKERKLLEAPLGSWDADVLSTYNGKWETFGILLWSLHLYPEIPSYNHYFPRSKLFQSTGIMPAHSQSISEFLRYMTMEGKPRSPPAVHREINIAEAWYWRSRAQALLSIRPIIFPDSCCNSTPPPKIPKQLKDMIEHIPEAIAQASARAHESQLVARVKNDDFGVDLGGIEEEGTGVVAYKDLPPEQHEQMKMLAEYRMLAFGWLTGRADWEADTSELGYINPISAIWAPSDK
ncbi:hypothetical protein K493DRAFT_229051 [Basidiobolus meristosporus CBS 931.73]|uniref:Uncharacterized protein n=1 Tax=Basidiobolus meristosporus CBS 931.73 TaxID=1314790 RepID=A0A1Y1XZ67_9FUNG|nr:hypothetical protein K493DRAFT_229051 [Basidiobolus meristosporus CBS 931.73]|eukprot:ORX91028.1 hypothetical protein K493DRAFT_229051 [Basidiobolus meristosporus CBS 931.73]